MSRSFLEPPSATIGLFDLATPRVSTLSKRDWTASRTFAARFNNRRLAIADCGFQGELIPELPVVRIPKSAMSSGYLALILHAHLPFVRHPEHQHFLEEDWLFEAITETYIPLLRMMHRLVDDCVPFKLTMSITPTL